MLVQPVPSLATPILDWLGALGLGWLLLGVAVVMALEASIGLGYVMPGDSVLLVTSTAAVTGPPTFAALVLVTMAGTFAGESVGFAIGRRLGPWVRRTRLGRWVGSERWARADDVLARRGGVAVMLSRFLVGIHSAIPVVAGSSPMSYRRFIAWTLAGGLPWACLYVGAGWALGTTYRSYGERLDWVGWVVSAAVGVWVVVAVVRWLLLQRRRRVRRAQSAQSAHELQP